MKRRVRSPFVTTIASALLAGASLGSGACSNPPDAADCPLDTPNNGDSCYGRSTCHYDSRGCEGSPSWTTAKCERGEWVVRQEGNSCNPPFPFDSGPADSAPSDGGSCPTAEPAIGSSCTDTARCSYANLCPQTASSAATNSYRCSGGKWTFENALESPIACPKVEPRDGEACGCAMYLPEKCGYPGTCGTTNAVCDGATQRWVVNAASCTDAGGDAVPSDALAGDAAPVMDAAPKSVPDAAPATDAGPAPDAATDAGTSDAPAAAPTVPVGSDAGPPDVRPG